MSVLDSKFKSLLQDRINELFLDAQTSLAMPPTQEIGVNIHEIGVLRGYMRACKEFYEECDHIMNKLMEPEKKQ